MHILKLLFRPSAPGLAARLEALRPRMYRVALAWTHDGGLADDLVQECLAKSLEHSRDLHDADLLEPWVFRILRNCWHDHLRSRLEMVDIEDLADELPSDAPGPEQCHARTEVAGRVRAAVASLPPGQRQVVALVDLGAFRTPRPPRSSAFPWAR